MNKKQWFLTIFSLERKIFKKSFLISNLVFLLLIGILSNLDVIIGSFGGDYEQPFTIYYSDDFDNKYADTFVQMTEAPAEMAQLTLSFETNEGFLLQDQIDVVLVHLSADQIGTIASNESIPSSLYAVLVNGLNQTKVVYESERLNLSLEDVASLSKGLEINRLIFQEDVQSEEEVAINTGITMMISLPLFIGLIMVIQMIGLEIFDEKSTKSMEVLMSNVDAKTHLKSKMWAANLFAVIQFSLILLYGLVGFSSRGMVERVTGVDTNIQLTDYISTPPGTLLVVIVLFVLTNMFYSIVMAILASTANEMDDFQKIQTPLMITMLLGFYAAIFSQLLQGAIFIKVMAFIPLFSLMLAPTLFVAGDLELWHIGLIVLVQLISVKLIFTYGVRIYKQAVLDYSNDNVFKRLMKNIRRAKGTKTNE